MYERLLRRHRERCFIGELRGQKDKKRRLKSKSVLHWSMSLTPWLLLLLRGLPSSSVEAGQSKD